MEPINYGIGAGTPVTTEDFLGGVQLGQNIGLGQQQAASAELARKQSMAAQQAHADMMARFSAEANREGGPTTDGIARLMVQFPSAAENLKKSLDAMAPAEKRERESQLLSTVSAINMKKPDIAIKGLADKAAAYRQAGREKDAVALESVADLIKTDPTNAQFTLNSQLAAWLGPDYEKAMTALQGQESTLREGSAKAKAAEAEAGIKAEELKGLPAKMAAELGLTKAQTTGIYMKAQNDKGLLGVKWAELAQQRAKDSADLQAKAGELPPIVFKSVDEAYGKAQVASVSAAQAEQLAREYQAADPSTGYTGAAVEGWKSLWGSEDEITALKNRWATIKNSNIIQNLPPGVASDRDIAMFGEGFPGKNANREQVVGFLKGMAKASRFVEAQSTAEAEWMGYNRSKAPARAPMVIQGVQVQPGMSYSDFQGEIVKRANGAAVQREIPEARSLGFAE